MRSITLKLILSFLIITLIAIGLMAYFSRQAVVSRFDTLLFEQAKTSFSERLLESYQNTGSLEDTAKLFRAPRVNLPNPPPTTPPIKILSAALL